MPRQALWKTVVDVILIPVALFRVAMGVSVDVAMTFRYPMALLAKYAASGVDPASAALHWPMRVMTGFYFSCVTPFMALLLYSLWTRKEAIRTPAIVMASLMAAMMVALIVRNAWGTPPSTNVGLFLLYNAIDVAAPILILARVLPRPLF